MTTPVVSGDPTLRIRQGVPYARQFTFKGAAAVWPNAQGCEARAQIRRTAASDEVLLDLTSHLVTAVDDDDILVTLSLTGQTTRTLRSGGVYDLYLSDAGAVDARAVVVAGPVECVLAVTR